MGGKATCMGAIALGSVPKKARSRSFLSPNIRSPVSCIQSHGGGSAVSNTEYIYAPASA